MPVTVEHIALLYMSNCRFFVAQEARPNTRQRVATLQPVNDHLREMLDYRKCGIVSYNDDVTESVTNVSNQIQIQINSQISSSRSMSDIISFQKVFELMCDIRTVHECAAL